MYGHQLSIALHSTTKHSFNDIFQCNYWTHHVASEISESGYNFTLFALVSLYDGVRGLLLLHLLLSSWIFFWMNLFCLHFLYYLSQHLLSAFYEHYIQWFTRFFLWLHLINDTMRNILCMICDFFEIWFVCLFHLYIFIF